MELSSSTTILETACESGDEGRDREGEGGRLMTYAGSLSFPWSQQAVPPDPLHS